MQLNITAEFKKSLAKMETADKHVFITGKAGTGKSTLLEYFRSQTDKDLVVLAPTGVAAVNVRGQTIHSFFGFGPEITVEQVKREYDGRGDEELLENLDAIIIDEVSMVRADLLDCVDTYLRMNGPDKNKPFGEIKMIFIGDPFQLEPVLMNQEEEFFEEKYGSPWFFDSHAFKAIDCEMIELTTIHRQEDPEFVEILNGIRTRTMTETQLKKLNQRVKPDYQPQTNDYCVHLTPTNRAAEEINQRNLESLETEKEKFMAEVSGDFELSRAPTQRELLLKEEAQVMLLNNDPLRRWVNGTMGQIREIQNNRKETTVEVSLQTGERVEVQPFEWKMIEFEYDSRAGQLRPRTLGTFKQLPMRLAWAVTIHKSQGKTLDHVILDTRRSGMFAHGQAYVALSRCTSLDGLVLRKPLRKKDVWMDWRVVEFFKKYHLEREELEDDEVVKQKLKQAISKDEDVEIVYVNSKGEKSRRVLSPRKVGQFSYMGNPYEGLDAYSYRHEEPRQYSLKRIARVRNL